MKKILILGIVFLISSTVLKAQDCFNNMITKKGTTLKFNNYDKKDNLTSTTVSKILDYRTENGKKILDYKVETTLIQEDTTMVQEYSLVCDNGKIYMDLESLINRGAIENSAPGMEIEVEGVDINYPNNPKVGQDLGGGDIKINFLKDGNITMTTTTTISNRIVESKENITVPAGTFGTFKITYDILVTVGFIKMKSKAAEWYSPKYGKIKTETYNKKGKLESYSVLTYISD